MSLSLILVPLALYVALVVGVGLWARRRSADSPEGYFLAGRSLGPLVLFMALFGTNATAFVLVGIPGRAYHDGIGVFGVNAPIIALQIPMSFWAIGSPARRMAIRLGALTPAELFRARFDSRALGLMLFGFFTLYTLPYMGTAVQGAALTLSGVTQGKVPIWVGGGAVMLVAVIYTLLGGMLGTAWTNVVQGLLFLSFMVLAFFFMSSSLGGLSQATQAVLAHNPDLLRLGSGALFTPQGWISWAFIISLTVIAFPHMLVRLMAGRSEAALKGVARLYPPALFLLWVPAVMIGVWGAAAFPGLTGRESDKIFSLMSKAHLPAALAPLGFLAVLAAVMSTLDAQLLTLSSMLTRDVLPSLGRAQDERHEVQAGRAFVFGLGVLVFAISMLWGDSVFEIAAVAFSGYVTLVPTLFFGVRWRRFTATGAVTSLLVGNAVLFLGLGGLLPLGGFLPAFWALVAGTIAAVLGSILTEPASEELTTLAFGPSR